MRKSLFERIDSAQALQILKEGNQRYVAGKLTHERDYSTDRAGLVENGQHPMAVVFCCSDSRVPPEIVFDLGIGQLFVVRTAGNTADAISIGSVEYSVMVMGAPLVLVLGHSRCGAVAAAIAGGSHGPNVDAIVNEVMPSLNKVREAGEEDIQCSCEDENISHTVAKLYSSEILSRYVDEKKIKIVSAKYDLITGIVNFEI